MILKELLNVIYRKEYAHYYIAVLDGKLEGFKPYTYNRIYKEELYKRDIYRIYNFSPDKYCYNTYWILIKGENNNEN